MSKAAKIEYKNKLIGGVCPTLSEPFCKCGNDPKFLAMEPKEVLGVKIKVL